jgi:6-phosphogluconate dehydrogenase
MKITVQNRSKGGFMRKKGDMAVVGLAVMGENLALNAESRGFTVVVYNRTLEKTTDFINGRGKGKKFIKACSLTELVDNLESPRKILLMIKAGKAVDDMIEQLKPLLEPGDIIIDGGNSLYTDTGFRMKGLSATGIRYLGCGISGGEEGALKGPSLMPGGDYTAWPEVAPILEAIAAKAPDGKSCCHWMGPAGAGHFVKMVHNGIEYGYMQIITEIYQIMRDIFGLPAAAIGALFAEWNSGELESYLMEITARVLSVTDTDGAAMVDKIVDSAGQKGTGRWTVEAALAEGIPLGIITEAVFFRALSADKVLRTSCRQQLVPETQKHAPSINNWGAGLRETLLLGQVVAFSQGFSLISRKSMDQGWNIPMDQVAAIWRGGCIIRSSLLNDMRTVFSEKKEIPSLVASEKFGGMIRGKVESLRKTVMLAVENGIPVPALASAVNYLSGVSTARTGINLLQAQRDFFGAHTFERTDKPAGVFFHVDWASLS